MRQQPARRNAPRPGYGAAVAVPFDFCVAVGPVTVGVGGAMVAVGGMAVGVGGAMVAVGGTAVGVGGAVVAVGGSA
ncbi:MAG: hypothetical protein ACR2J8_15550, partial [Thermomicrobiales bacterium]